MTFAETTSRARTALATVAKRPFPTALVLMYHRVAEPELDPWGLSVTPGNFAQQLDVLRERACPVALTELVRGLERGRVPRRAVAVTFDDGYVDNLTHALPLLEARGMHATVFVASGYVGRAREYWWDELELLLLRAGRLPDVLRLPVNGAIEAIELGEAADYPAAERGRDGGRDDFASGRLRLYRRVWELLQPLGQPQREAALDAIARWAGLGSPSARGDRRPMTADELAALARGGLVEIGAHTVTHPLLPAHDVAEQRAEIGGSRRALEALAGRPVTTFSYPYGGYAPETVRLARAAGFACACTTGERAIWRRSDPHRLARFGVGDWSGEHFEELLGGWLRR